MRSISSAKKYLFTGAALLMLLGVTVGAACLNLGWFNPMVAFGIAGIKAWLVLLFFMNLRRENHLIWLAVAAGFFWLVIMFALTMGDVMTRH